ncbi:MAG: hypothetical protein ACRDTP_02535 [Mycobacteriales bacterium]
MNRLRYAFVALSVLMLALAGVNLLFTVNTVQGNDHKFCQVITATTAAPVPKPSDPAANPSREQGYEWYLRFVQLGRSLGC